MQAILVQKDARLQRGGIFSLVLVFGLAKVILNQTDTNKVSEI